MLAVCKPNLCCSPPASALSSCSAQSTYLPEHNTWSVPPLYTLFVFFCMYVHSMRDHLALDWKTGSKEKCQKNQQRLFCKTAFLEVSDFLLGKLIWWSQRKNVCAQKSGLMPIIVLLWVLDVSVKKHWHMLENTSYHCRATLHWWKNLCLCIWFPDFCFLFWLTLQ